ncbi:zinc finger protein 652-B-like [Macrosteles quadrilineatus]|uniref:zinc finger protein 652-B-like n=1 Tax=Macrosteles quadrilineatus TaxID=74068 RepID=UPI0023E2CBF9|nr:zinc finger protein 652-B-like [Macrosteles quadrilineatus]XP_054258822.1 zinc finger protein 652-B-like [Macrosteles quadrilineatus]
MADSENIVEEENYTTKLTRHDKSTKALQEKRDNILDSKYDLVCQDGRNSCEKNQTPNLTEKDHENRRYYHKEISQTDKEEEVFATYNSSDRGINSYYCKNDDEKLLFVDKTNIDRQCKQDQHNEVDINMCQDQPGYHIYLDHHKYQRKDYAIAKTENHSEESYSCRPNGNDKTLNQSDEASTIPNETHVNTDSKSYIQMKNLSVDVQDSCDRKYEYPKDSPNADQINHMCSQKDEICDIRDYTCNISGKDHLPRHEEGCGCNDCRSHCHDEYYQYEMQDENIYRTEEHQPQDQTCRDYQLGTEHEHCYNKSYNHSENEYYAGQNYRYHQTVLQNKEDRHTNNCSPLAQGGNLHVDEVDLTFGKEETSAVDLRVLRPLRYYTESTQIQESYRDQEPMTVSDMLNDSHITHYTREDASLNATSIKHDYVPHPTFYREDYKNASDEPSEFKIDDGICETMDEDNNNQWDAATNTEHIKVEDKGSQTGIIETREVAVQTDIKNAIIPLTFFKNIEKKIANYTCHICHRVYISKPSFERHLRTHKKEQNNVFADVKLTTETKLQICKRSSNPKNLNTQKPIIIHVPRSILQCEKCYMTLENQKQKDNHNCCFTPFSLIKCPECHIKFYTPGALNEHIGMVHKKDNAYYCIFCNKSFNAGYNFHLHLDEHLSNQ